jgi:hypothetical protein
MVSRERASDRCGTSSSGMEQTGGGAAIRFGTGSLPEAITGNAEASIMTKDRNCIADPPID